MLMTELDTLGKAWSNLEEQSSKNMAKLLEKEEQITKISVEVKFWLTKKAKLEQKISLLSKQSNSFNNLMIAQKKQSEKQLEQIRRLEELERHLNLQLVI
jgi:seryl-tRNA synthetase